MVEGMVLQDECGRVRYCNRSAERIFGFTAEQLCAGAVDNPLMTAVDRMGRPISGVRNPLVRALRSGRQLRDAVLGIRRTDGELCWLQVNTQPVLGHDKLAGPALVATFVDITREREAERRGGEQLEEIRRLNAMMKQQMRELEKANEQLELLAAHDGLTGLKNHRAFHERLDVEVRRAHRYHDPLSIVILDVDHFKLYNDSFGHPAGDAVLRQLAAILNENARESDVIGRHRPAGRRGEYTIARHGGEEFALILPHTDAAAAMKVAERLRAAVERSTWHNRPVTASFGVATLTPACDDANALIAAADKALYRSKTRGRNRVTCARRQ